MAAYEMISAEQARRDMQAGALLINGYDVPEKWEMSRVPGAISYLDFAEQAQDLPRDTELMFYCA
jgi:rhodanese-related sulfurtransferase